MQSSYIYSVSRVNTLGQFLLGKTDIERLLVADAGSDLTAALKETYLASYLTHVPNEDVPAAIEQTLIEAKNLIQNLAPKGDMFRPLWVRYDVHNLRVLAKATAKELSFADCQAHFSDRGIYEPSKLASLIEAAGLNELHAGWQEAYTAAVEAVAAGKVNEVDGIFDALYFATCAQMTQNTGDRFMQQYLARKIDLYNIKSQLRHLAHPEVSFAPRFVDGGTVRADRLENREDVLAALAELGTTDFFKAGIDAFEETGNTTQLDMLTTESILSLAKESSVDMFSSASLVLYYLRVQQAAANIRTIVVGKNSGMTADAIRSNLSLAYVNN